jgi:hypothetical protein
MRERDKPCFEAHKNLLINTLFSLRERTTKKTGEVTSIMLESKYITISFVKESVEDDAMSNIVETFSVRYEECDMLPTFPGLIEYFMPHDLMFVYINERLIKICINDEEYHYRELEQVYGNMKDALAVGEVLFEKIGAYIPT